MMLRCPPFTTNNWLVPPPLSSTVLPPELMLIVRPAVMLIGDFIVSGVQLRPNVAFPPAATAAASAASVHEVIVVVPLDRIPLGALVIECGPAPIERTVE
ncbi:MAG: hypothetical protein L3J77_01760 [Thermoplasmata archaeon]|nr:hypothetical protein [Thermoplasmata archaeon]